MTHTLKYATIVPSSKELGESTFAAARAAIQTKYGVTPPEVFLDSVRVDGTITAGDVTLDLGELSLRYLVFGADYPADQPTAADTAPADAAAPEDAPAPDATTTTTVTA